MHNTMGVGGYLYLGLICKIPTWAVCKSRNSIFCEKVERLVRLAFLYNIMYSCMSYPDTKMLVVGPAI